VSERNSLVLTRFSNDFGPTPPLARIHAGGAEGRGGCGGLLLALCIFLCLSFFVASFPFVRPLVLAVVAPCVNVALQSFFLRYYYYYYYY